VPGVLVDRVAFISGNETGQQSNTASEGHAAPDDRRTMDGINITDGGAGASPSYYNYDLRGDQVSTAGRTSSSRPAAWG
jgi:hypothetical protein